MTAGVVFVCQECAHRSSQWAGRCSACGAWGTLAEAPAGSRGGPAGGAPHAEPLPLLGSVDPEESRKLTGIPGFDRVLGGGLVPASVVLIGGEPGIGKSTLLLHVVTRLASSGLPCLLVCGEESRAQVGARARRLGLRGEQVKFAAGRDLDEVLAVSHAERPFLLAVDSIQSLRDTSGSQMPGGVSQVRTCADALVGLAKAQGVAVLMTGHMTKDGDLAGPRALEHAVDVVLAFEGDARSGLRVLTSGKNRFGSEGESAWFQMGAHGLAEIDPTAMLVPGQRLAGSAVALPRSGRRAIAVEVQALIGGADGSSRRQATGLDLRRFQQVAAVVERAGLRMGRADLFAATSGGIRVDDPACDLAVAIALASAAAGVAPPQGSAFVGEIALTGMLRPGPGLSQRISAARSAGCDTVFAPVGAHPTPDAGSIKVVDVSEVSQALSLALTPIRRPREPALSLRSV